MGALESRSADVTISIVSFNSRDFLVDCLRSTYAEHGGLEVEVIVVDNASTDGSAELIRREFPDVTLIVNEENRGFAAAHNQATRLSSGRYLFLLNPDTVLLPGSLTKLASFMDGHPEAGAAAASTWLDHGRTFRGGTHKVFNLPFILLAHTGLAEVFPNNKIFRDGWEIDRMLWQCEDWCEMELLTGESLMVRRGLEALCLRAGGGDPLRGRQLKERREDIRDLRKQLAPLSTQVLWIGRVSALSGAEGDRLHDRKDRAPLAADVRRGAQGASADDTHHSRDECSCLGTVRRRRFVFSGDIRWAILHPAVRRTRQGIEILDPGGDLAALAGRRLPLAGRAHCQVPEERHLQGEAFQALLFMIGLPGLR